MDTFIFTEELLDSTSQEFVDLESQVRVNLTAQISANVRFDTIAFENGSVIAV